MPSLNIKKELVILGKHFSLQNIFTKIFLLIIITSLFLPWTFFPLSQGKIAFQINSEAYSFFGYILLFFLILCLLEFRYSLLISLIFIFLFPIKLWGNYIFLEQILDERYQISNLIIFAKELIYEPNIVYFKNRLITEDYIKPITSIDSRFFLIFSHLGFGYFLAVLCSLVLLIKLKYKELLILVSVIGFFFLSVLISDVFLNKSKKELLNGNYVKSASYLNKAKIFSNFPFNSKLHKTENFNLLVGENHYFQGNKNSSEAIFFHANQLEQLGSYSEALEKYILYSGLTTYKQPASRALVKKLLVDLDEKKLNSYFVELKNAYMLDPNRIETLFYLLYISSALSKNEESIKYGHILIEKCGNKVLLADAYNILAKAYISIGKDQIARDMYKKSLNSYDNLRRGNYHAWEGIAGW